MNVQSARANLTRSDLIARRGELLAELFLQELDPAFISRPTTPDFGASLLVGFRNEKAGINMIAVQVKSTEQLPGPRFPIPRSTFNRIAHSNLPNLLLVVDVKQSRLHFAWLRPGRTGGRGTTILIPLIEITEITKAELKRQLKSASGEVGAA
jgi:Domain of unknown function (DUF4365)